MNDSSPRGLVARLTVLTFGVCVYVLFLATFSSLIAFVEGVILPFTTSDAVSTDSLGELIGINAALIALFGIQHTIMARPRFKAWWTRIVPKATERPIFVLTTCGILALMFTQWRTMPGSVWNFEDSAFAFVAYAIGFGGWGLALLSTFLIDHFHLFGLKQAIGGFFGKDPAGLPFRVRSVYRMIRHPLYLGMLLAFWVTPDMTVGRLSFAALISLYLCVGIRFEERTLQYELGDDYTEYQRRVPMLLPRLGAKAVPSAAVRA